MSPLLLGLVGGFAAFFSYLAAARRSDQRAHKSALEDKVQVFRAQSEFGQVVADEKVLGDRTSKKDAIDGFIDKVGQQIVAGFGARDASNSMINWLDFKLVMAGRPNNWTPTSFLGFWAMLLLLVVFGLGVLVKQEAIPAFLYVLMCWGFGVYPWWKVERAIKERKEQAFSEFPDFLDEMILGMSSGSSGVVTVLTGMLLDEDQQLALPGSDQRVLAGEFRTALLEFRENAKRFEDAFRGLAARLQIQEVDDLVELLVLDYTDGPPILPMLQDQSRHVYAEYEHRMTSLIKKQDTTFTVGTAIMMMAAGLIIAAPILFTLIESLTGGAL